jgi:serine-type D-Ala-D-Ala carboxypeptidase (penicillin-binding protein 5/6)
MRRSHALVAASLLSATLLAVGMPSASAEPIGGPLLTGSDVIVDPGPTADPLPEVPVTAWVLADLESGAILAAKAPHVQRPPASVLKALTLLTLTQELDPDLVYTTTYDDVAVEGSRVGLVEEATYTAQELFLCLMMQSGNDCASALASANGGLELSVAQMKEEAQRLQAYDTVAINTSGLPAEGQVSSAYDLAVIAREGLARPDFFEYVNTRVVEDFPGYMPEQPGDPRPTMPIATQNPLFIQGYDGAIGVKTGWTTEAGRTFVGAAERDGTSLVVTLLNIEGEIYPSASALLDWGFANIDAVTPVGYLVDPIDDGPVAVDEQTGGTAFGGIDSALVDDAEETTLAAGTDQATGTSTPWAWVWTLVGAMIVGLMLVVLGLRSLRGPAPRQGGRRARHADASDADADSEHDFARG